MLRRNRSLARVSVLRRAVLPVLLLAALGLRVEVAPADECSNPCDVRDGDLCAPMKRVIELGDSLAVRPGRQGGTCGGVRPLAAGDLVLTWSRDPSGPFTPMPVSRHGDDLMITPDRPGPYFIEAAARDGVGAPDRLVVMVVDPKTEAVRLQLRPGKGLAAARTAIKVRWVPATSVDRFPRRRWPVWWDNDRAGLAGNPLRLPPGRYDVEWTERSRAPARTGVTTIEVAGPGPVDVALIPPGPLPGVPSSPPGPAPAPPPTVR